MAVQRCTVHKERNLLAHAPKHLHDEIKAEFNDMMHAGNAEDVLGKRKAFLARWKLRCRPVADSLEEAGERLFTFLRYPPQQWRSLRTTDEIDKRFLPRPITLGRRWAWHGGLGAPSDLRRVWRGAPRGRSRRSRHGRGSRAQSQGFCRHWPTKCS